MSNPGLVGNPGLVAVLIVGNLASYEPDT